MALQHSTGFTDHSPRAGWLISLEQVCCALLRRAEAFNGAEGTARLRYRCLPGLLEKELLEWLEGSSLGRRAVARPGAAASRSRMAQAPKSASRMCPLSATSRLPDLRSLQAPLTLAPCRHNTIQ